MEKKDYVPYLAHEEDMARLERTIERLWILAILLVVLLVGSNVAWIYYEHQFEVTEETTIEQEVETGEGDTIVNGIGDINYGEGETEGE